MDELNTKDLLNRTTGYMSNYISTQDHRPVFPDNKEIDALNGFDFELQQESMPPEQVIDLLHTLGAPATVTTTGGRYFGFVIGGALPVSIAANCLSAAWDQCAGLHVLSPVSEKLEQVAGRWLKQLLGLPAESGVGFVTGATMGNFTALATARHSLLSQLGWDVGKRGLFGAPEIQVVVGEEVHVSILKVLSLLGLGSDRIVRLPVDGQGRLRVDTFNFEDRPTIVCLQAGNVDSGAVDPLDQLIPLAKNKNAWVHIDGAFGLWAAASKKYSHLVKGLEKADSWSVDLHKWLNVPYDNGVTICRYPEQMRQAMSVTADYLPYGTPGPYQFTPGLSRRARGIEAYAAMHHLGKSGVSSLVETCCKHAQNMANGLEKAGFRILNQVVLNQVIVDFGAHTEQIISGIQKEGTCWAAGTKWHGKTAMRISISSWATTDQDIKASLNSIIAVANSFK